MVIPLVTEVSWAVTSRVFCAVRFVRPGTGRVAWLGRAEQTCQDAGDEIWVAAREFLGVR
jgi:hypothetical protein